MLPQSYQRVCFSSSTASWWASRGRQAPAVDLPAGPPSARFTPVDFPVTTLRAARRGSAEVRTRSAMLPLRCRSPGRVSIAANSGPSHRRLLEATPTCAADLLTARSAHPDPQDDPDVGRAGPRVSGPPRRLGTRGRHETHLAWGTWISIGARSAQRPTTTPDMLSPRLGQATPRRPTRRRR